MPGQGSHITKPQRLHTNPTGAPGGEMHGLTTASVLGTAPGHPQQPVRSLATVQSAALTHSSASRQLVGLVGSATAILDKGAGCTQFNCAQRPAAGHAAMTAVKAWSPYGTRHGSEDRDAVLTATG
jgi:hypothetical protein